MARLEVNLDPEVMARRRACKFERKRARPASDLAEGCSPGARSALASLKIVLAGREARVRCEPSFPFLKILLRKVSQQKWALMPS